MTPSAQQSDPAVRVAKIGYVGFATPDVARLVEHYTTVLGFVVVHESPTQVFLTTGADHHCMVVDKARAAAGRTHVGWQVYGTLDDAERRLADRGLVGKRRSDTGPGVADVLVVDEPGTGTPLHLYDEQSGSGLTTSLDHRPTKLGHVAAFTPDLAAMQAFYQDGLGFRWSDTIGDFFVFLRCNADHHAANFMSSDQFSGLHHVAFEARDPAHLITMIDNLAGHGVRLHWGPGRHAAGHNLFSYHFDPDGNDVELFTQLDVIYDEERGCFEPRPWHEDSPQVPKTWEADAQNLNRWGPLRAGVVAH